MTMKIENELHAYVTLQNTDLTEGRGRQRPLAISRNKETALRIGRGKDVQGSDCSVEAIKIYRMSGFGWRQYYGPITLTEPNKQDIKNEEIRLARKAVLRKAKELGLTDEEIALL